MTRRLSLRTTIVMGMLTVALVIVGIFGTAIYRLQADNIENAVVATSQARLQPVISLATRAINEGNQRKLEQADALDLYRSVGALYIDVSGVSTGAAGEAFSPATPVKISYRYLAPEGDAAMLQAVAQASRHTRLDRERWLYVVQVPLAEVANGGELVAIFSAVSMQDALALTLSRVWPVTLLVLILAVFLALIMGRRISLPIEEMAADIGAISQSLNLTHGVTVRVNNEVGDIATAFNAMVDKFAAIIKQLKSTMADAAKVAHSVSLHCETSHRGLCQQKDHTEELARAIGEMSLAAADVSDSASKALTAAQNAGEASKNGQQISDSTRQSIEQLNANVASVAQVVQKLGQESESIGSVVDVIRGIAEQTNLLALNAAIEAARAGEHGRGFAVVADEVRGLASKTQRSTEEIHEMIERLRTGISQAVDEMKRSLEQSSKTLQQAEQGEQSLVQITQSVDSITAMNQRITSNAMQQQNVTTDIARNISELDILAEQSVASADEIQHSSEKLSHLASEAQGSLAKFSVG